jgi:ferric-dicitrate binding protein FerR (iron transport regulator)
MNPNIAQELLQRYLDGTCDSNEKMLVEHWYRQLDETGEWEPGQKTPIEHMEQRLMESIAASRSRKTPAPVRNLSFLRRWWVAAALLLVLGTTAYLGTMNRKPALPATTAQRATDIAPGKEGAILTLADGRQVILDSMGNGTIAQQNGVQVVLKDGQLSYESGSLGGQPAYNTMHTPKGRQFQVRLPDGTKAWLNAASSITYPIAFNGTERSVKITGEVYFEVAGNREMPFTVNVNDKANVEVLGTHFNVNAYENERHIATTLLEGSVRVANRQDIHATGNTIILQPGEQARIATADTRPGTGIQVIKAADIDQVTAWKNGFFDFEGAGLKEMMLQVERWYDITVVFEKGVPDTHFAGKIKRNVSLNGILKALDESDIHYRLDDERRLVLLP